MDVLAKKKEQWAIRLMLVAAWVAAGCGVSLYLNDGNGSELASEVQIPVHSVGDGMAIALQTDTALAPMAKKITTVRTAAMRTEASPQHTAAYLEHLLAFGKTHVPEADMLTTETCFVLLYKAEYVKQNSLGPAFEYANFLDVYLRDRLLANENGFTDADFALYIDDYLSLHGESRP